MVPIMETDISGGKIWRVNKRTGALVNNDIGGKKEVFSNKTLDITVRSPWITARSPIQSATRRLPCSAIPLLPRFLNKVWNPI